jgi:flagellum-specific peptidoglycan hydrolase FlgJ
MSYKEEFINKYKDDVINATIGTNIFPSVKMAQMIIESGWGNSSNAKLANNFFGIKKGVGWNGEVISLKTPKDKIKVSEFRKYKSPYDSIVDHSSFLIKNKRYENAGVFNAKTVEKQVKAIAKAGYAEDKKYADVLISIINSNDLKKLDEEAKKRKKPILKLKDSKISMKTIIVVSIITLITYFTYKKFKQK